MVIRFITFFILFTSTLLFTRVDAQYMAELITSDTQICESQTVEIKVKFNGIAPYDAWIKFKTDNSTKYERLKGSSIFSNELTDGVYTRQLTINPASFNNDRIITISIASAFDATITDWGTYDSGSTNVYGQAIITSYETPTPNAGEDASNCGYSIQMTATPGSQSSAYYWQTINNGSFINSNDPATMFTTTTAGSHDLTFVQTNGACETSDVVKVTLFGSPTGEISTSSKICGSGNAILNVALTGSSPWDIRFSDGSATNDIYGITAGNHSWTQTVTGEKTFHLERISDKNGCTAASNQMTGEAKVEDLTPKPNAGSDDVSCELTRKMNASSDAVTGSWSGPEGSAFSSVSDETSTVTVTTYGDKTFTWTLNNDGCTASDEVTIKFIEPSSVSITDATPAICEGSSGEAKLNITGSYPWILSYLTGTSVNNTNITESPATISLYPAETTEYQITKITDTYGCNTQYSNLKFTVQVDEMPKAYAGEDQQLHLKNKTTLEADAPSVGIGTWSLTEGIGNITEINNPLSEITGLRLGSATLKWTIINGLCSSEDDVNVEVQGHPTGFSPNGDGINDRFEIIGASQTDNNELVIFNQAGKVVYKKKNYCNDWDGTGNDGDKLPDGCYYFVFSGSGITPIKDYLVIKR